MSGQPKMFRINPENRESEAISEVEFARLGFQERRDIQEWVAANPVILGDDLLIIGKEFSGFDKTNERPDLLAVDRDGKLVVIELKRDDTGADAHWQAIKYASYFRHATADDIIGMLANYGEMVEADARERLLQHLGADDLNGLNHDQRIILASHRFAPEVTSAVLWLNEKAPDENLLTCVQLIPYRDDTTRALYVQASTIIPRPGVDVVKVGDNVQRASGTGGSDFGQKLSRTYASSRDHETTPFFERVSKLAIDGLPDEIKPNITSKWSCRGGKGMRYYHFWYTSPQLWGNHRTSYRVNLYPQEKSGQWQAYVRFQHDQTGLKDILADISFDAQQDLDENGVTVDVGYDTLNDDFGSTIAATVRRFIEEITPIVNDFADAENDEVA